MTQYLNPWSGRQFLDANGNPYAGAKLFIYSAGSSTKVTTTKDQAGLSNHANPIILNTRGEPAETGGSAAAYPIWQPGSTTIKLVLAPANDTDPPASAIATWDNIAGINDASAVADQWVTGPTPTFVSTTQFTLVGDQTSTFHVGRRLKLTDSGGTDYATITVSAYTTLTTITVAVDSSGVLDSGLSAVSYGLLSATNSSWPAAISHNVTHTGTETFSTATAGGTPISIIGTDAGANGLSLPLYHNSASAAGSDILANVPFQGNSTTGVKRNYATIFGVTSVVTNGAEYGYLQLNTMRAGADTQALIVGPNGVRVGSGALTDVSNAINSQGGFYDNGKILSDVIITSQSASASATIDFAGIDGTWDVLVVEGSGIIPSTGAQMRFRVGTGGTPTYQTSSYVWAYRSLDDAGTAGVGSTGASTDFVAMTNNVGDVSGTGNGPGSLSFTLKITNCASTAIYKMLDWRAKYNNSAANALEGTDGIGRWTSATAVTALRFYFGSGNIQSGRFVLKGIRNS